MKIEPTGLNLTLLAFANEQPKIALELLKDSIQKLDNKPSVFIENRTIDFYA